MIKRYVLLLVVALSIIGSLFWFINPKSEDQPEPRAEVATRPYNWPRALASSYRVLKAFPDELTPEMKSRAQSALGRSLSSARMRVQRLNTALGAVWVTAAAKSRHSVTCLIVASSGASACASTKLAARVGLAIGTRQAGPESDGEAQFSLLGIVPNWVKALKLKEIGHAAHLLPVRHNVYATYGAAPVLIEGYCGPMHASCVHPPLPHQRH